MRLLVITQVRIFFGPHLYFELLYLPLVEAIVKGVEEVAKYDAGMWLVFS